MPAPPLPLPLAPNGDGAAPPSEAAQLRALLRFHRGGAVRVALRASTLSVAVLVFALGSAPEPARTLRTVALSAVAREAPPAARGFVAAVALSLAVAAVPRVTLGAHGWLRTLPVRAHTAWRAAALALGVAQLPVALAGALAAALTLGLYARPLDPAKLAGLALLLPAAAVAALSAAPVTVRALGLAAVVAVVPGRWTGVAAALAALAAADGLARGAAVRRGRRSLRRTRTRPHAARAGSPAALALATRLTWRAAGGALGLVRAIASAALPLAAAYAVRRNNPTLAAATAERVARVATALAVAFVVAALAERVHRGRPVWGWARALPWSAAGRAGADALALLLPALVSVVVAAGLLGLGAAGCGLMVAPLCAAVGAAALRHAGERHTGAAGETLVLAVPAAVATGLWPTAAAPLALALVVPALRLAARRERRPGMTTWRELRPAEAVDRA